MPRGIRRLAIVLLLLAGSVWQGCAGAHRPPSARPATNPADAPPPPADAAQAGAESAGPQRPEPRRVYFHAQANEIRQAEALAPFFARLRDVAAGRRRKVDVVQLGDSHVQADHMTAALRRGLQAEFGAAGRGLVFPHSLAHTNGAADVLCWSNVDWTGRRLSRTGDLPVGLSAHGALPVDAPFWFKLGLAGEGDGAHFDRIRLFAGPLVRLDVYAHDDPRILETTFPELPPEYYTIRPGDYLGRIAARHQTTVRRLMDLNGLESDRIRAGDRLLVRARGLRNGTLDERRFRPLGSLTAGEELRLGPSRSTVFLHGRTVRDAADQALYGFYLENVDSSGVVVSAVGANGARYRDYAAEPRVIDGFVDLRPDLVLISLGTNEATGERVDAAALTAAIDAVVGQIRSRAPDAAIVLTTPPDHFEQRRRSNPRVREVRRAIIDYAQAHGLAWWDLYDVMGGAGSMRRWHRDGLAAEDRIHFTTEGYRLQGELLLAALLRAYDRYDGS